MSPKESNNRSSDYPWNAIFRIRANNGAMQGTCFLVGNGWHLLTANHVVADRGGSFKDIKVEIGNKWYSAHIQDQFDEQDVALLRLEEKSSSSPLELSRSINAESKVRIPGFPTNVPVDWHSGEIAGPARAKQGVYQINFDIGYKAQLAGLSGAPVFDEESNVIGLVITHNTAEPHVGEIATVDSFYDFLDFALRSGDEMHCFVVLSEAERKVASLKEVVSEALQLVQVPTSKSVSATFLSATNVVSNWDEFNRAIRELCRSEIAVFDVTNYEPAVMLLLGIRSVVRRGITIASIGEKRDSSRVNDAPFNIKEVNFISHFVDPKDSVKPRDAIKERIRKGFNQGSVHQYLDLPAFDAIRNLPPEERTLIPHTENVLLMCSYSKSYEDKNLPAVSDALQFVIEVREKKRPVISRILDINRTSPRLISQMIYESIRRVNMCIVDWTEWRPNIFFELGVRLAVSKAGTVCIIEADHKKLIDSLIEKPTEIASGMDQLMIERLRPVATQCKQLLRLFSPISYDPDSGDKMSYESIVNSFNESISTPFDRSVNEEGENTISPSHIYNVIWRAIDLNVEIASAPVYRLLLAEADLLSSDITKGKSAVLYPENQELGRVLRKGVEERLLAAWYLLRTRYTEEDIRASQELSSDFEEIGKRLAGVSTNPGLGIEILDHLDKFKAKGTNHE